MIAHQAEAIVLRTWPVHEADQIVSLLTRDAGKLKGVAKSAARSRRRFGGALEPMTHVRASYVVRPRQELVRLESFEIIRSPLSDPIDYPRIAALAFYAEVLEEMLPENDPQDAIFRLLVSVLGETQSGRVWMPVTYFALWIMRLMGWMPELTHCTACRHRFSDGEPAWWRPQTDGLFCEQHRSLGSAALSPLSLLLAARMLRAPVSAFAGEPWSSRRAADLRRFSARGLERHLEGPGDQRLTSLSTLLRLGS
ncbi:MAG TPA: DNA repair protein RecO [Acidobacteriaceae bacterium]